MEQVAIVCIHIKRRFTTDRFRFPAGHDWPLVMSSRQLVQMTAQAAKHSNKRFLGHSRKFADFVEAQLVQSMFGFRTDAPQTRDGQISKKDLHMPFLDNHEAIGLLKV